ncbi:pulmonary surfactant-associated protein C-like [Bombina bombina]|uniref:pulmonary surfactant-associated protein C-like n=1 Tax=Bombina bombina TaxID=8345 RepID=UPI00235ABB65|nr:pulmonary surfactant-associated protein C-like [Bombina bombina]
MPIQAAKSSFLALRVAGFFFNNNSYNFVPKMNDKKKTWAWSVVVLMLLAVIVVGATLIGVYMTQKHTEAIVEMAFHDKSGERVQQTIMVNEEENVAAFYVNANNVSSTIVYDYKHKIIAFRRMSSNKCYVMNMTSNNSPKITDILKGIKRFQSKNTTSENDMSYDIMEGDEADRSQLGVTVNVLCSEVPIYWATQNTSEHLRWKLSIKFNIFGFEVSINFES